MIENQSITDTLENLIGDVPVSEQLGAALERMSEKTHTHDEYALRKELEEVKEGLRKRGGYCPCITKKSKDTKCMCKQFREQIQDPDFEGYCGCLLYYKEK